MPNQQLADYIKKSRELGHSDSDIKASLLNAGHKEEDVRRAFDAADGNVVPLPTPPLTSSHSYSSYGDSSIALPGPVALLRSALQVYRARFWGLLSLTLLPILVSGAFLLFSWGSRFFTLSTIAEVLIYLLLFVLIVIISVRSAAALIFAIIAPQPVGFFEAFKISKGKTISFYCGYIF